MRVVKFYSHKGGRAFISRRHRTELRQVISAIEATDAVWCLRKITKEKTKPPLLFHPESMNFCIKKVLHPFGWTAPAPKSKKGFKEPRITFPHGAFREMDGIKNKVGLEIQFGKYAFMGYDIFSKMVIFAKRRLIECGIEVVAMPEVVKEMSTGVSSFNQIVLDMGERGVADIDIPTLIVGIGLTDDEQRRATEKRLRFRTHRAEMIAAGEVSKGREGASPGPKGAEGVFVEALEEEEEEEAQADEQV
jgi:hypothetical protein